MRLVSQPTYGSWMCGHSCTPRTLGVGEVDPWAHRAASLAHLVSTRPVSDRCFCPRASEFGSQHPASDGSQPPMTPATGVPVPTSSLLGCHLVAYIPTDTKIRTGSEELHLRLASGVHMQVHIHKHAYPRMRSHHTRTCAHAHTHTMCKQGSGCFALRKWPTGPLSFG